MAAAAPRSTTTEAKASGIASSLERAKEAIQNHGCATIPIVASASELTAVEDLPVLSAKIALQNNANAAMVVQPTKKRSSNGDAQVRVGWCVIR